MLPDMTPPNAPDRGTVFIQNAYLTRNDPESVIKPGMIKAIRVNALGVQPRATVMNCSMTCPNEIPKKVLGTVPVDESGSAFFNVPARTSLQMQVLDENGMAILTEKSFFYLQPGENRSCIGCHEPSGSSPNMSAMAGMARSKPLDLNPPAGPQYRGGLSFMRTVQPVLDRYCIKCHGLDKKEKDVDLVHDGRMQWPKSFVALVERGDHEVGNKPYMGGENADRNISRPRRFYAFSNKVAHMLATGEKKHPKLAETDRDSYMRIIEWMDLNAQCYGDYFPNKIEERTIDKNALNELRENVKRLFGETIAKQPERALINPAQPDESRILMMPLSVQAGGWGQVEGWKSKDDPEYKKMTELVEKCIVRIENENVNGWEPTLEMGAGEEWVMQERKLFLEELKAKQSAGGTGTSSASVK